MDEKQSWILHDIVQGLSLMTVIGMMITGILFITEIKEDQAVQESVQKEHERRITAMIVRQDSLEESVIEVIRDLRNEHRSVHVRLFEKIDVLMERAR